jgi:hypothetical protein
MNTRKLLTNNSLECIRTYYISHINIMIPLEFLIEEEEEEEMTFIKSSYTNTLIAYKNYYNKCKIFLKVNYTFVNLINFVSFHIL